MFTLSCPRQTPDSLHQHRIRKQAKSGPPRWAGFVEIPASLSRIPSDTTDDIRHGCTSLLLTLKNHQLRRVGQRQRAETSSPDTPPGAMPVARRRRQHKRQPVRSCKCFLQALVEFLVQRVGHALTFTHLRYQLFKAVVLRLCLPECSVCAAISAC